jgi:hypothetical protein
MKVRLRIVPSLFLVSVVVMLNGCTTTMMLHMAEDSHEKNGEIVKPEPWHYALLPLTIPFDIVTFPLQLPFLAHVLDEEEGVKR